ncbi:DUF1203 domain-containing protein [Kordiimonas marina]|uniref:DUF1203 domain-containing protein n=1 Tax=Kordiimonas marina TaxID=2872312 RepID=UPI001FF3A7D7|nr:DUF1203 domain-containing protein [Kordiimonas marina]MCJ9429344.1 DUF1203 domain-containing protein [Kordiimonas marina]
MGFQVTGLPSTPFEHLFGKSDADLAALGARAYVADSDVGFPCRVEMRDAQAGERVILVGHEHLPVATPYRSSHAVFVLDGARAAAPVLNGVSPYLSRRLLSVRSFGADGMMLDADVCEGRDAARLFTRLLANGDAEYLHVHTARRGCYLARVDRA